MKLCVEVAHSSLPRTNVKESSKQVRAVFGRAYDLHASVPQLAVQGVGCRVQGVGCRVQGAGCRVQGRPHRIEEAGGEEVVVGSG